MSNQLRPNFAPFRKFIVFSSLAETKSLNIFHSLQHVSEGIEGVYWIFLLLAAAILMKELLVWCKHLTRV